MPLVVNDKIEEYKKTKDAVMLLKRLKAWQDILKVTTVFTFSKNLGIRIYLRFLSTILFCPLISCIIIIVFLISVQVQGQAGPRSLVDKRVDS